LGIATVRVHGISDDAEWHWQVLEVLIIALVPVAVDNHLEEGNVSGEVLF